MAGSGTTCAWATELFNTLSQPLSEVPIGAAPNQSQPNQLPPPEGAV